MIIKAQKSRLIICCLLYALLLIATTSCSLGEGLPLEKEIIHLVEAEERDMPIEEEVLKETPEPKIYDSFSEAYLGILTSNSSTLTDELLSDAQIYASEIDIGDGKIALVDVFGDETPELLYIYTDPEVTEFTNRLFLKIFTFSEADGVISIFDSRVYSASGGGSTYCVFQVQSGGLMGYYCGSGAYSWYGFWPIINDKWEENAEYEEPLFYIDNRNFAKLFYIDSWTEIAVPYMQYGKEITEKEFNKIGKEIMEDIDKVLFQGPVSAERGLHMYKQNDFWKDITPFEEICMTYDEAVVWLKAQ